MYWWRRAGWQTALEEEQQMCVILPEAKHGVASETGLQNKGWEHRGLQCSVATSQSWMVTSSWSWWTEEEQRLLVSSIHKKRLPFHLLSSKCLQLPISLSWLEASYWKCTPHLQEEALQQQDSGEQQRHPWEVLQFWVEWGRECTNHKGRSKRL